MSNERTGQKQEHLNIHQLLFTNWDHLTIPSSSYMNTGEFYLKPPWNQKTWIPVERIHNQGIYCDGPVNTHTFVNGSTTPYTIETSWACIETGRKAIHNQLNRRDESSWITWTNHGIDNPETAKLQFSLLLMGGWQTWSNQPKAASPLISFQRHMHTRRTPR